MDKINVFNKGKKIAVFYYDSKVESDTLETQIAEFKSHFLRLKDFFGVVPSDTLRIQLLYDKKEMDEVMGEVAPDWVCGKVDNDDELCVYLYSQKVIEKYSTHKKDEFFPTIIHEVAHTFVSSLNGRCFRWIDEGLCLYTENANNIPSGINFDLVSRESLAFLRKNNFISNYSISWDDFSNNKGYVASYITTKYIIDNFGKEKAIDIAKYKPSPRTQDNEKFIKDTLNISSNDLFKKIFQKYY